MKKICFLSILILALLSFANPVLILAQKAPEGIAGLKWGDGTSDYINNLDDVTPLLLSGDPFGLRIATRWIRRFGDVLVDHANYCFFEDRFCG